MFAAASGNLHISVPSKGANRPESLQSKSAPSTLANTRSPIRHLIVVVGENRSFDNVFGTYLPPGSQTIWNLLSQGIVLNNGTPGPNVALAAQQQATDTVTYELSPTQTGSFAHLPQPNTTLGALPNGPCILAELIYQSDAFCSDVGLDATSQGLLQARGTGQSLYFPPINALPVPDCRYPSNLPNAPYSLIGASQLNYCGQPFLSDTIANTTYTSNTGDPVHRFYQM
jgi:phospholipase C